MTITTTDTRPDRCTACQGHRLPAPHGWATDGDLLSPEHTTPHTGGLTLCGDLHQFVSELERDICIYCDADNGPRSPGEFCGPGRMGFDCGMCGGS